MPLIFIAHDMPCQLEATINEMIKNLLTSSVKKIILTSCQEQLNSSFTYRIMWLVRPSWKSCHAFLCSLQNKWLSKLKQVTRHEHRLILWLNIVHGRGCNEVMTKVFFPGLLVYVYMNSPNPKTPQAPNPINASYPRSPTTYFQDKI